ncbi:MAG: hypothetical protein V3V20_09005 [Algisphaera sp.]
MPALSLAQSTSLPMDDARLIDGLVERRLDLLLDHLAQTGHFEDPSLPRLVEIGQLRAAFLDSSRSIGERRARLERARDAWRQLLDNPGFAGHPQMPVWRTQLAEQRLVYELEVFQQAASAFYEFGVPTQMQSQAFEEAVPAALAELEQAERDFQGLSNRVSRDRVLKAKLESTLAYYRIFNDYRDQKTRYYTALARYLATLLPDDHPVWLTAEPANAPAEARTALLRKAAAGLAPFVDGSTAVGDGLRVRVQSLAGRVATAQGDTAGATQYFDAVASSPVWNLEMLAVAIARARLAGGNAGLAQLKELAARDGVASQPAAQLLVADARFCLLRDAGQNEAAYGIYFDLLDDPALGNRAVALRQVIYDRWASALGPNDDLATFPPAVRLGVADIARRRGLAARAANDPDTARTELRRAVQAAQTLVDDPALDPSIDVGLVAAGRYQLAYARSLLEPTNLAVVLNACQQCAAVARDFPHLPVATDAITLAASLVESLHRRHGDRPGVAEAFEEVGKVLFGSGQFDTIAAADDRRLYFTHERLQAAGYFAQAATSYDRQLPSHRHYADAQSHRAECLVAQWRAADLTDRKALVAAARVAIDRVEQVARTLTGADFDAVQPARARARLVETELAVLSGLPDEALRILDRYEEQFVARADLMPAGLERRILLLVDTGDLVRARSEASAMMGRFSDGAAPVINAVLNDLERRIARLAEVSDDPAVAAPLADTAAGLAKLLADWADGRGLNEREMLPYQLVVLKSLRIAGRSEEALAYLKDSGVAAGFPNNVDVLLEHARALAATERPEALQAARPILNRVLKGLSEPYPSSYWAAWATRLEVSLALDEGVRDIPRRVRLLEARHPSLGGEPWASRLQALAGEAAGRIK